MNSKLIIVVSILSLAFHVEEIKAQKARQKPVETRIGLTSQSDSLQYALGAFMGNWININGFTIENRQLFNQGLEDVLKSRSLLIPDSSISLFLANYQVSMQNEKNRAMEEQLFKNLKSEAGIGILPSGVHYLVIKTGTGKRPLPDDAVTINTIGLFPDGSLFEDTFSKKQAFTIPVSNLIPGLSEAVQLMQEGSVWRIFVPSRLGYGKAGLPGLIPPDAALVFELTLEKIETMK